jgi:hypothetical protein
MYEAAASCKDITRAPVTNWEPRGVTLAGYCYAVRHGMKIQLITPYRAVTCNVTALRYAVKLQACTHLYWHSSKTGSLTDISHSITDQRLQVIRHSTQYLLL